MPAPPRLCLRLHPQDNVLVALVDLAPGTALPGEGVTCAEAVPAGHKVAGAAIAAGQAIRKYGQIMGFATRAIAPGGHVHVHNVAMGEFSRDYAIGEEARPTSFIPEAERAFFQGLVRPDGRVATRNYVGVLAVSNCAASVAKFIARSFTPETLAAFPHVDGVIGLGHWSGCGMGAQGENILYLRRSLAGYARHPNFGGVVLVGLGCEVNQLAGVMEHGELAAGPLLGAMVIQDTGGTRATVARGVDLVKAMLPEVNRVQRRSVPASHLVIGLECGGSDAYSGLSANPALGAAADLMVAHGGTAVLSETPEIYGAEHLLTRRAERPEVAEKLLGQIKWWEDYTAKLGGEINNNPTPGNKAGGLTTILEKSLGGIAKAGSTNLRAVYGFAEPITEKGLVFMDTPGLDPISVTGLVAGGVNVVVFTTGRGSVFGSTPASTLKLATNTAMYRRLVEDMDLNCGLVVDGEVTVAEMGRLVFEKVLEVASGNKTKSELLGMGDEEFVPWLPGPTV